MKPIISKRKLPLFLVVIVVSTFVYSFALMVSDDPRVFDNALTIDEAYWWELLLVTLGLASMLLVWGMAIRLAWRKRQNTWLIGVLFIWPLSLIYVLLHPYCKE